MKIFYERSKIVFVLFFTVLSFVFLSCQVFASDGNDKLCTINSIVISQNKDTIEFDFSIEDELNSDTVYIFKLEPYESDTDIIKLHPATSFDPNGKEKHSIKFDVADETSIYERYIFAIKNEKDSYRPISYSHYIDNPEILASNTEKMLTTNSKKGLFVQLPSDAQELGVSHTVINLHVNEYILPEKGENTLSLRFNDKTYYINSQRLSLLDHKIKLMSDSNVNVFLNILLSKPSEESLSAVDFLYFKDYLQQDATFYAFNVNNPETVYFLEGFLKFIAERYTDTNKDNGFAGNFIIGYETNEHFASNNTGAPMPLNTYMDIYARTLRIAHSALTSTYTEGKIYASLSNRFNISSNVNTHDIPAFSVIDFISSLNDYFSHTGNFDWRLAINPYPSVLTNTEIWSDPNASDSINSRYITMKNIEVMLNYVAEERFCYNGEPRHVLISEFGTSGIINSESEKTQAAAFVYAYIKAAKYDQIDALIYHRHIDHSDEKLLYFGLWASNTDIQNKSHPTHKKIIYDIYKHIDVASDNNKNIRKIFEFTRDIIGEDIWDELVKDIDISSFGTSYLHTVTETDKSLGEKNKFTLFDFSLGSLYSFFPTDNTKYIEIRDSELYAKVDANNQHEYMGIGTTLKKENIKNATHIEVLLSSSVPESIDSVDIMIRLCGTDSSGKKVILEGKAKISPQRKHSLVFDIEDFVNQCSDIETLKIWMKPSIVDFTSDLDKFELRISEISIYEKASMIKSIIPIMVFVGIIAIVILGILINMYRSLSKKDDESVPEKHFDQHSGETQGDE